MTLPSATPIKMSDVRTELGRAAGTQTSLGETAVRALAGKPSGTISIKDLLGKSNTPPVTLNTTLGLSSTTYTNAFQSSTYVQLSIQITGHAYIFADINETGNWASSEVGDGVYEVRYTVLSSTDTTPFSAVTNDAPTWKAITSASGAITFETRARIESSLSTTTVSCNATFRVEIRKVGTTTNIIDRTLSFSAIASPNNIG